MRVKFIILLIAVIFALGCQNSYSFGDALGEIRVMDKKYNSSFYTEALDVENIFSDKRIYDFDWNRTIIRIDFVEPYKTELEALRERVKKAESKDNASINLLIDARIKMLESQRLYEQGHDLWETGNAEKGFSCKSKYDIMNLSNYYNESSIIGQDATSIFDDLLTNFIVSREFLTGKSRPKFYDSPFWPIRKFSINNKGYYEQLCK